jgi:ATP-binding cassette, subfamily F, member 3
LAGQLDPVGGTLTAAPDVMTGFFAQIELEHLDSDNTALAELGRRGGPEVAAWTEQQRRDHLGRFGFRGERVFEPTGRFSGGERARLALAILVARKPNLLLLDEPTNHLDLEMRHALLVALQEFAGAVVVVSHDRTLLRGACDTFLLVAHGSVSPFDGDLDDYAAWLAKSSKPRPASEVSAAGPVSPSRQEQRRLDAEAREPARKAGHRAAAPRERAGRPGHVYDQTAGGGSPAHRAPWRNRAGNRDRGGALARSHVRAGSPFGITLTVGLVTRVIQARGARLARSRAA